jgi:YHS domain-containing protein
MKESGETGSAASLRIDAGVRAWYASCRCCLSDAHPDVVAVLDAERDAAKAPRADAGICEVAEGTNTEEAPMAKILDPICDMVVDLEEQRGRGLVSEHAGTTYAFCGPGCKKAFDKDPGKYAAKVATWQASGASGGEMHH